MAAARHHDGDRCPFERVRISRFRFQRLHADKDGIAGFTYSSWQMLLTPRFFPDSTWRWLGGGHSFLSCYQHRLVDFQSRIRQILRGWFQALTRGLPEYAPTWTFFRNTLLSGGLFTGFFVGAMKLTESANQPRKRKLGKRQQKRRKVEAAEAEAKA